MTKFLCTKHLEEIHHCATAQQALLNVSYSSMLIIHIYQLFILIKTKGFQYQHQDIVSNPYSNVNL